MDSALEIFNAIGTPVRIFARLPFLTRYLFSGFTRTQKVTDYAKARYGKKYYWRPWLLFDMEQLEQLEYLINKAPDAGLLRHKRSEQEMTQMVSVVGTLMAGISVASYQLPGIQHASFVARGSLLCALVTAILVAFLGCLQQQTYGFLENPQTIRAWLSNGVIYVNSVGENTLQSSGLSNQLLHIPFEMLCLCITTYIVGIGIFVCSALTKHASQSSDDAFVSNRPALIVFAIIFVLALVILGLLLGGKENERQALEKSADAQAVLDQASKKNEGPR